MKKITERQQIVLDLLRELAVDGKYETSNGDLACLLYMKKMSGFNGRVLHHTCVRRFLLLLKAAELITIEGGRGKRKKIIRIIGKI